MFRYSLNECGSYFQSVASAESESNACRRSATRVMISPRTPDSRPGLAANVAPRLEMTRAFRSATGDIPLRDRGTLRGDSGGISIAKR